MPLAQTWVDVASVVVEVFEMQRPLAEPQDLNLFSAVPSDLPPAWADRGLLLRILQNLTGNAIKFTPRGGEIRVRAQAAAEEPGMLQIQVANDGPGIPEELRGRLFEKFVTWAAGCGGSGWDSSLPSCGGSRPAGRIGAESPEVAEPSSRSRFPRFARDVTTKKVGPATRI